MEYEGQTYFGYAAQVPSRVLGAELGAGTIPACDDTNASAGSGEDIVVVELVGVPGQLAVAVTYSDQVIFIRRGSGFESLPTPVLDLVRPR